jgi:hypothetical protein
MEKPIPESINEIAKDYKTLFFHHIPKAAGKYVINQALKHEIGERVFYIPHPVSTEKVIDLNGYNRAWVETCVNDTGFQKSLCFTIVRNPFDYLVSEYYYGFPYNRDYEKLRSIKLKLLKLRGNYSIKKIKSFLREVIIELIQNKKPSKKEDPFKWQFNSFEHFINCYCDPDFPWIIKQQHKFLFFQLFGDNGKCAARYALRSENLNEGLIWLCKYFNIKPNISDQLVNASRGKKARDYKLFYNSEMRKLVEKKCKRELEAFGYSFDGHDNRIIIDTKNLYYNPHTDIFKMDKIN